MRPVYSILLSAVGGFALGYTGMLQFSQSSNEPPDKGAEFPDKSAKSLPMSKEQVSSEGRVASVLTLSGKSESDSHFFELYSELQKLTAGELKEMAPKMVETLKRLAKEHSYTEAVGEAWMERWLEVDASAALEFLSASMLFEDLDPKGVWNESFAISGLPFRGAFKAVARHSPEWTRNFLLTIKDEKRRDYGVHLLATAAAQKFGLSGKKLIADFLGDGNRRAAIDGYAIGLAQSSPDDAFQIALAETPGPFREKLMEHVLWEASRIGSASIRALLDRIGDPDLRARMAGQAIGNVSSRAGENVRPWLEEEMTRAAKLGSSDFENWWDFAIQEAVREGDFKDVADWALSLKVDAEKNVLSELSVDWATREPATVQSWLRGNADRLDEQAVKALDRSLQKLVNHDPQAAAAWAESLPPGPLRDSVWLKTALRMADVSNGEQAASAYRAISASDTDGSLAKRLATTLSKVDGSEAGAWALELPEGTARTAAIRAVASEWGQRDPKEAAVWINALTPGPERDIAIEEYAARITYAEPSAGAEWVLEIQSEASRQRAAERVFGTWRHEDPAGAIAWLRQLPGVGEEWRRKALQVNR